MAKSKAEYLAEVTNPAHCFTCEHCLTVQHRRLGGNSTRNRFCSQVCRVGYNAAWKAANPDLVQQREADKQQKAKERIQAKRALREPKRKGRPPVYREPVAKPTHYCVGCACVVERAGRCDACRTEHKKRVRKADKLKYKAMRRVRQTINAESIDPIRVFELHKWECQHCGVARPKRLRGTYKPNAPELDHIVTLADKGGHTWGNVQCLCRSCNAAKGSRSLGQMGLGFI